MLLCAPPPPARESDWSRHCCCAAQHTGWRVSSLNGTCRRAPLLQLFLRDPLGAAADPGFGVISPSALMRIIPTSSLKAPSCPLSPASPRQAQGSIASAPPPSTHTHRHHSFPVGLFQVDSRYYIRAMGRGCPAETPGPGTPSSSRCTPNLRVCLTSKLASRQAVMVLEEGAHGEQGAVLGSSSARSSTGRRADPSRSPSRRRGASP